ncbi:MAG: aminoacyl-tRNA hydrolase [Terrimicrobiaceae bacterium]|nr:aminoacyl-tRNA hydrolase [Terrimicrobiaceae bacterium]
MEGSCFRLVAGLGNPGREYDHTRHNVGFFVADALARRFDAQFVHESKWNADVARAGELVLMKPMTFMNLSGESIGDFSHYFKIEPDEVLVIIDDAALPLGRLRLRRSGSDGGHNGLASALMHLGTEQVPRLRVGIGGLGDPRAAGDSLTGHVLGKFSASERAELDEAVNRAADAVELAQASGLAAAMNRYNSNETN